MKRKLLLSSLLVIGISILIIGTLLFNGVIWFNNPSPKVYPVRGIDVSSYQGVIDWNTLSKQNIDFAFIKATEGSSSHDNRFSYNWANARKTQLRIGAYHFFSFDSSGLAQAMNFTSVVPIEANSLPPVVDVELYGEKGNNIPDKKSADIQLSELLNKLEEHYGEKPILYVTSKSYDLYVKGSFNGYKIWIRDILQSPELSDKKGWIFWQYSNRQVLKGYKGQERFIDMNVFKGTKNEFENFAG